MGFVAPFFSITWSKYAILLSLCLLIQQQGAAHALDEEFKEALLLGVENLLHERLNEFEFQLKQTNNRINQLNDQMVAMKEDLTSVLSMKMETINNKRDDYDNLLLNSIIMNNKEIEKCPDGIIISTQCFVITKDQKMNWASAEELCQSRGLILAEASDIIALALRNFIIERYGDGDFWLNAKSNESHFIWQRSNIPLVQPNQLFSSDDSAITSKCLSLSTKEEYRDNSAWYPYYPHHCEEIENYPLCEKLFSNTESLKSSLQSLEKRCTTAEGFFWAETNQCFKYFNDIGRSWDQSKALCEAKQLVLAEITDETAVALRKYILDIYGDGGRYGTWVAAHGDGTYLRWIRSRAPIRLGNPFWWTATQPDSRVTSRHCLRLMTWKAHMKQHNTRTYHPDKCSTYYNTLCELL